MIQELINDLHYINSMGETPDGDGITVNVQLWAERWITRLEADSTLRDAERYRWLRAVPNELRADHDWNPGNGGWDVPILWIGLNKPGEELQGADLDNAVDAAMAGANARIEPGRSESLQTPRQ